MGKTQLDVGNLVVLVAEDDPKVRELLREFLGDFGFKKTIFVENGEDAWAILKSQKVNLIICDWEMPKMTGYELLKRARADSLLHFLPFIMITSPKSEEEEKVSRAMAAEVDHYLIKPFRVQTLQERIEDLLGGTGGKGRGGQKEEGQGDRAEGGKAPQQQIGILLVEDSLQTRAMVVEYLNELGYTKIFEAENGQQGFNLLKIHADEIGIVISDWEMPQMAGIDLLKKIRAEKKLRDMPFIMITSQTSIERLKLKRAIEGAVNHYLLKPFKLGDLRSKIQSVLDLHKQVKFVSSELDRAEECLAEGDLEGAEEGFRDILKLDPTSTDAMLGLGKVLRQGDAPKIAKAIEYIERAIRVDPTRDQAHLELAFTHEGTKSLVKAISVLKKGLVECRFSEQLHYHLGRLYLLVGRRPEAVTELRKALEIKPDFSEASMLLNLQEGKMLDEEDEASAIAAKKRLK